MQKIQAKKSVSNKDMKHFIAIVGLIVGSFLLVMSIGVFAYVQTASADSPPESDQVVDQTPVPASPAAVEETGGFIANLLLPPEKTNFMIVGVDEGESLTDVMLVGSFDRDSQKINVISIPRDTRITMSKEDIKALNDLGRYPPSHGVMKMNSVNAYAGKAYGMEYLQKQLESLLEIKIDYYALVNLKAFRNIVTTVGGIWMEIPAGGLYYNDPDQNLTIQVPGGRQLLDGEKAEGVVRYRATYSQGDLQRIGVQQQFMKEFFSQVMTKDAIMKNAASFLATIISYVRTDFGIQDIPQYLRYVTSLKGENITFHTLPGYSDYLGEASYFFYDPADTAELVQEIFYKKAEGSEILPTPGAPAGDAVDLTGISVQLLNGTDDQDIADKVKEKLEAGGVNVVEVGNYKGSQKTYTRVVTRQEGIADGFKPYFKDVVEELDGIAISSRFDAVIILGTGEPETP